MPRYDKATRKKVWSRIKQLHKEGLKNREIAAQLNTEGFTNPSGGPCTPNLVSSTKFHMNLRSYRRKPSASVVKTAAPKSSVDTDLLALCELILGCSQFGQSKKLQMIKALLV